MKEELILVQPFCEDKQKTKRLEQVLAKALNGISYQKITKDEELKNLQYPPKVIFAAKQLADEAVGCADISLLRELALKKYESLQDVVLN